MANILILKSIIACSVFAMGFIIFFSGFHAAVGHFTNAYAQGHPWTVHFIGIAIMAIAGDYVRLLIKGKA